MLTPSEKKRASERLANIQKDWQKLNERLVCLLWELRWALEGEMCDQCGEKIGKEVVDYEDCTGANSVLLCEDCLEGGDEK